MSTEEITGDLTCDRCSNALVIADVCTLCQGEFCEKCFTEHQCPVVEERAEPTRNPEPNDVASLKRDDLKRAYVLLGLDPAAWEHTSAIYINPFDIVVERFTTSPAMLGPDGVAETMTSTIKIEG